MLFDPLKLVEKVVALIPPPRANLLRYHGVFAPNSKDRSRIVPEPKKVKARDEKEDTKQFLVSVAKTVLCNRRPGVFLMRRQNEARLAHRRAGGRDSDFGAFGASDRGPNALSTASSPTSGAIRYFLPIR